ncbi:MAG: peptidoglycan DD-metalloendopeptidase family protein [Candidatus Peribacteraceae bacterium]
MRSSVSPNQAWLSVRVRVLCASVFMISLFVEPYIAETTGAPPDLAGDTHGFLLAEEGFLMKTSPLTEQGTRSAFTYGIIHTVEPGESITTIAKQSFITADTIRWANNLTANSPVLPGQKLLILPVDGVVHEVKRGQSLNTIAELYDIEIGKIREQNKLETGYLVAGDKLIIPGAKPIVEPTVIATTATVSSSKPTKGSKAPTVPSTSTNAVAMKGATIESTNGILQMPCDCFYTQYFGNGHYGIDLQHRGGSTIFAGEAGTVIRADYGWNGGYGNVIEIDHGNGIITLYAHNKELYVQKGDVVARGHAIAFMGNTGRVHGPTGIHLHLEVIANGVKKNPTPYLK